MEARFKAHRAPQRKTPAATPKTVDQARADTAGKAAKDATATGKKPKEIGGPSGPEPTRYGDWERKGICVDF